MGRSSAALVLAAATMMVAAFVAASSGGIDYGEVDLSSEEALWALYERWSAEYNVKRQTDEKARRFNIFRQKARYIHDFNKQGDAGYTLGLNHFSDMTNDEINEISTCDTEPDVTQAATHHGGNPDDDVVEAPDYVDWRLLGVVSDPKDQGTSCGSCWAFAATGAIESLHAINNDHQLLSLSAQQLVDCDERSSGCQSGNAGNAFQYVTDSGGLALDSDYPYRYARSVQCLYVVA
jgi:KDEL-tailed cysteine endopeptidase